MSWGLVTDEWRLKLLAVGLAVLMFGAVAFSQNPPTTGNLTIPLVYTNLGNLILINPPTKINVTYTGLADAIRNANPNTFIATVDLSHASTGPAVRVNVNVRPLVTNLNVLQPPPIAVNIDTQAGKDLPVTVNARNGAGWTITKHDSRCAQVSPCIVHFTGPASWESNLQAFVDYPGFVQASSIDSSNWPVRLINSNGTIDLSSCHTQPCVTLDQTTVSVHIEAVAGSTSSTVALVDAPPVHPPASGYRITDITITPNTVTVSGDPVALSKIRSIQLPPVDLSGKTSDAVFQVQFNCPADSCSTNVATVKYFISQNPNVTPT